MKVALIQITSVLDPHKNLEKLNTLLAKARQQGAVAAFLPEVFYSMSDGTQATPYLIEKDNEHYRNIQNLAIDNDIAIIGGSCATKFGDKVINRAYNFDQSGRDLGFYDKNNLFAVNISSSTNRLVIDETIVYSHGNGQKILDFEGWKIGLSICFDLRFPELYRSYFDKGTQVFTVSSAFTVPTGKAHWETLLKARAIENQSYVIASNQVGKHNSKISTYGHSMIVSPWGEVLCNLESREDLAIVNLDINFLNEVRARMNIEVRKDYLI